MASSPLFCSLCGFLLFEYFWNLFILWVFPTSNTLYTLILCIFSFFPLITPPFALLPLPCSLFSPFLFSPPVFQRLRLFKTFPFRLSSSSSLNPFQLLSPSSSAPPSFPSYLSSPLPLIVSLFPVIFA